LQPDGESRAIETVRETEGNEEAVKVGGKDGARP